MTSSEFESIRTLMGQSQKDLAASLGMSPTTVCQYEAGKHRIPRHVALALAALWHRLDITIVRV